MQVLMISASVAVSVIVVLISACILIDVVIELLFHWLNKGKAWRNHK